jgi:hypothetical protein
VAKNGRKVKAIGLLFGRFNIILAGIKNGSMKNMCNVQKAWS